MVDHPQKPGLQLQTLVDAAAAPPPFLENSYCSKCKKDTDHEATCRFVVWPEQRFLAVFLKRTLRHFANGELPVFTDFLRINLHGEAFDLVAGIVHYGARPTEGHYCSFRRTADAQRWLYTNDSSAFFVNLSDIQAAVPYVLFFLRA